MLTRRAAMALVVGGGLSLASACVAAPPAATPTPLAAPPTPAPVPTAPPTVASTVAPTSVPPTPPTALPTAVPSPRPTTAPTAVPTLATPPALAAAVASAMQRGMQRNATPGGVVLIRHKGAQLLQEAYGLSRKYDSLTSLSADPIPATTDTLYDLASVSKLFTTTCVMRLVEQNRLALDEPVARWMPEFAAGGKDEVTLRQLLTHTSGLP